MHPELRLCLKSLNRAIYFVTDEEDRAIQQINTALTSSEDNKAKVFVFSLPFGVIEVNQLMANWKSRSLGAPNSDNTNPLAAFHKIYSDDSQDNKHFYIILDPERWLNDAQCVRAILNIIGELRSDPRTIKCLIFLGSRLVLPQKLQRYIQVVRDNQLTDDEILDYITTVARDLKRPVPPGAEKWFKGMTSFEIETAVAQSIVRTRTESTDPKRIDKTVIQEFKRRRINSTDLLKVINVDDTSFAKVGGVDRFKTWVEENKPAWTQEGRNYGLKPPKGVLCVGVWGCGKSLSVKAMGNAWKLPVVLLELGKLRSSGVGDTEAAAYTVISYLEAMSPCIAWVDEAEKTMAGGASSSFSDAGTTARTLGILSTWHQETKADVCMAMTANSLKTLPPEFANRIEDKFFFDLPDTETRIDILKIIIQAETIPNPVDIKKFPLRALADASKNLVPREMEQAVKAAVRRSFHENKPRLDAGILEAEFNTRPRILDTLSEELKEVLDWVGWDPDKKEGRRARFASTRQSSTTLELLPGGSLRS